MRCQIGTISSKQTCSNHDFSEMSLPGVEFVPIPCGSILHTTRASQLPHCFLRQTCFRQFRNFLTCVPEVSYTHLQGTAQTNRTPHRCDLAEIIGFQGTIWNRPKQTCIPYLPQNSKCEVGGGDICKLYLHIYGNVLLIINLEFPYFNALRKVHFLFDGWT